MTMTRYVAGFMFRDHPTISDRMQVALIEKTHPEFQRGKWNGIGGKIRTGEKPEAAMVREFAEEAGCPTLQTDWFFFCRLYGPDWEVFFYSCMTGKGRTIGTMEEERVEWVSLNDLDGKHPDPRCRIQIMPNLAWLIPLALDKDRVQAEVLDRLCAD